MGALGVGVVYMGLVRFCFLGVQASLGQLSLSRSRPGYGYLGSWGFGWLDREAQHIPGRQPTTRPLVAQSASQTLSATGAEMGHITTAIVAGCLARRY